MSAPSVHKSSMRTPSMHRRAFVGLTVLCTAAYFISYVSRINLSAAMVEIVASGFALKTTVALALSVNSLTYCIGQIISGYLSDRYRPQNVMLSGFLLAGAMNLGVAIAPDARYWVALWAINGFAQALMWPPIVRILSQHMNRDEYAVACKYVGWGGALGTMAVYLTMPLLIGVATFRAVFIVSGLCALVMAVVWTLLYARYFAQPTRTHTADTEDAAPIVAGTSERFGALALVLMLSVIVTIVLHGSLRDGVSNWLPTLVSESFHLSSSAAILSGVLLPIFHIFCTQMASLLYRRVLRNEVLCSGVIFGLGALCAALLALVGDSSALATVILCAALVGTMHGCNFILTCMVPACFARYGHVSLISGTFNAATYIGSAISTYGIALFSQACGWTATFWLWAAIAAAGMAISFVLIPKWAAHARQGGSKA